MKYFLDTEFIEGFHKPLFGKKRHFIDLISIGIVAEDGREYYAISKEYNYHDANDWVKENVIAPLYLKTVHGDARNHFSVENFHKHYGFSHKRILADLLVFFKCWRDIHFWRAGKDVPEVYGYFADYDWVLFCSLFGRMMDLPKGFPMYCRDLKQEMDIWVDGLTNSDFFTHFHIRTPLTFDEKLSLIKEKNLKYPAQEDEHNALEDAKWNLKLFKFLTDARSKPAVFQ